MITLKVVKELIESGADPTKRTSVSLIHWNWSRQSPLEMIPFTDTDEDDKYENLRIYLQERLKRWIDGDRYF